MTASTARDALIVAIDADAHGAHAIARSLEGVVRWLKVGMTLYYSEGPDIVRHLLDSGFDIFLDLKLHDIPHQVESAAAAVSGLGVGMLTVHAGGGAAMVEAAVRGSRAGAGDAGVEPPSILGVTVLTSMNDAALTAVGVDRPAAEQVPLLARVAQAGGAQGVVCSPLEAALMREVLGERMLVVTPGVRPSGAAVGDQARVASPRIALESGASHLVIGRPVTGASDPRDAALRILDEMEGANSWLNP